MKTITVLEQEGVILANLPDCFKLPLPKDYRGESLVLVCVDGATFLPGSFMQTDPRRHLVRGRKTKIPA